MSKKYVRWLYDELPEWVGAGVDPDQLESLYELYFPRRHYFLSDTPDHPERGLEARLAEEALRAQARELRRRLALPASTFLDQLAARDPLGAFPSLLQRLRDTEPGMRVENGQFVSRDGRFAVLMLRTRTSAFDNLHASMIDA